MQKQTLSLLIFFILISFSLAACGLQSTKTPGQCGQATQRQDYPEGPYGTSVGSTIADLTFTDTEGQAFELGSLYRDTSKHLLLLSTAAGWCKTCKNEVKRLQALHEEFSAAGLVVMTAVFEDERTSPAQATYAAQWMQHNTLEHAVVADTPFVLQDYYDTSNTPMHMFIDLNTMKIEKIALGAAPDLLEAYIASRCQS